MSSPIVDPRRPEKVNRYKAQQSNGQGASDDLMPDYMNILGMVFSMCGLMMKLKWCGKFRIHSIFTYLTFSTVSTVHNIQDTIMFYSPLYNKSQEEFSLRKRTIRTNNRM